MMRIWLVALVLFSIFSLWQPRPALAVSNCIGEIAGQPCPAGSYPYSCQNEGLQNFCCQHLDQCLNDCLCTSDADPTKSVCSVGCGYAGEVACTGDTDLDKRRVACLPNTPARCNQLIDRTWVATFRACLDLGESINQIIGLSLWFVGGAALIRFLVGAVKFIMSTGDPKKLMDARDTLTNAVMGLVLVTAAYLIARSLTDIFGGGGIPINFLGINLGL